MSDFVVVEGALIKCANGACPTALKLTEPRIHNINGKSVCYITDNISGVNILPFGVCALTQLPCVPVTPIPWLNDTDTMMGAIAPPVLSQNSKLLCTTGGMITVQDPGQTSVPVGRSPFYDIITKFFEGLLQNVVYVLERQEVDKLVQLGFSRGEAIRLCFKLSGPEFLFAANNGCHFEFVESNGPYSLCNVLDCHNVNDTTASMPSTNNYFSGSASPATGSGTCTSNDNSSNSESNVVSSQNKTVHISSITGNKDDVGQPPRAPKNASNITKGYIAVDYFNVTKRFQLTLTGSGFGDKQGKGSISFSDNSLKISKISNWTDHKIIFILQTTDYNYSFNNVTVTVTTDNLEQDTIDAKIVGSIQTRPWGQCTWEVARVRLSQDLAIPPSAYYTNTSIDANYIPTQWDAIVFGDNAHVGIIISSPRVTEKEQNGYTKITYEFTLQDRNSSWDEKPAKTSQHTFVVLKDSKGKKSPVSSFSQIWAANGCYR